MLQLLLMPRCTDCPGSALMDTVTDEVRVRAAGFVSDKRRADFLWSRVLLGKYLRDFPDSRLVEAPPRSPRIAGPAPADTCVSHTATWVGAAVCDDTVGIDLEVMNPARVSEPLFTRLFDKRHWEASENRVLDFYGFFGMYESAVKMNLPFASDCDLPYVGRSADKPCSVRFLSDGTTLLTIVTEKPEEIALRVFDTDKAARTLEEIDNPFVPIAGPSCLQP